MVDIKNSFLPIATLRICLAFGDGSSAPPLSGLRCSPPWTWCNWSMSLNSGCSRRSPEEKNIERRRLVTVMDRGSTQLVITNERQWGFAGSWYFTLAITVRPYEFSDGFAPGNLSFDLATTLILVPALITHMDTRTHSGQKKLSKKITKLAHRSYRQNEGQTQQSILCISIPAFIRHTSVIKVYLRSASVKCMCSINVHIMNFSLINVMKFDKAK